MARRRSTKKSLLKVAGIAAIVVVGYDLYKGHTALPAVTAKKSRLSNS